MTRVAEQIPATRTPYPAGAPTPVRPTARAPRWRSLLEARWQARLQEVTELSLAYHDAAAAPALSAAGDEARPARRQLRHLLRQAVTARKALADTEDALTRLASGRFGRCEHCATALPTGLLAIDPEARYCVRCVPEPEPAGADRRPRRRQLRCRPRSDSGDRHAWRSGR
jgi:RNA polymerase-binding transcription factor DksA